jgi:hypothetical protein
MEKSISKLNLENPIIKENFIKSLNEKKRLLQQKYEIEIKKKIRDQLQLSIKKSSQKI